MFLSISSKNGTFIPTKSEDMIHFEQSFLKQQQENIQKVDALVNKAELTLQAIKTEFDKYIKTSQKIMLESKFLVESVKSRESQSLMKNSDVEIISKVNKNISESSSLKSSESSPDLECPCKDEEPKQEEKEEDVLEVQPPPVEETVKKPSNENLTELGSMENQLLDEHQDQTVDTSEDRNRDEEKVACDLFSEDLDLVPRFGKFGSVIQCFPCVQTDCKLKKSVKKTGNGDNKPKKGSLTIQRMPAIEIPRTLVMQKGHQIAITPDDQSSLSKNPFNMGYAEVVHPNGENSTSNRAQAQPAVEDSLIKNMGSYILMDCNSAKSRCVKSLNDFNMSKGVQVDSNTAIVCTRPIKAKSSDSYVIMRDISLQVQLSDDEKEGVTFGSRIEVKQKLSLKEDNRTSQSSDEYHAHFGVTPSLDVPEEVRNRVSIRRSTGWNYGFDPKEFSVDESESGSDQTNPQSDEGEAKIDIGTEDDVKKEDEDQPPEKRACGCSIKAQVDDINANKEIEEKDAKSESPSSNELDDNLETEEEAYSKDEAENKEPGYEEEIDVEEGISKESEEPYNKEEVGIEEEAAFQEDVMFEDKVGYDEEVGTDEEEGNDEHEASYDEEDGIKEEIGIAEEAIAGKEEVKNDEIDSADENEEAEKSDVTPDGSGNQWGMVQVGNTRQMGEVSTEIRPVTSETSSQYDDYLKKDATSQGDITQKKRKFSAGTVSFSDDLGTLGNKEDQQNMQNPVDVKTLDPCACVTVLCGCKSKDLQMELTTANKHSKDNSDEGHSNYISPSNLEESDKRTSMVSMSKRQSNTKFCGCTDYLECAHEIIEDASTTTDKITNAIMHNCMRDITCDCAMKMPSEIAKSTPSITEQRISTILDESPFSEITERERLASKSENAIKLGELIKLEYHDKGDSTSQDSQVYTIHNTCLGSPVHEEEFPKYLPTGEKVYYRRFFKQHHYKGKDFGEMHAKRMVECTRDDLSVGEVTESAYSDGEIKCRCDTSIGEIKLCKYVSNIKSRVQYLKRHPKKLMEYELGNPNVTVVGKRMHYNNWYSYYVSSPTSSSSH